MTKPATALALVMSLVGACHLATEATDYVVDDGAGGATTTGAATGTSTGTSSGAPAGTSTGTPTGSGTPSGVGPDCTLHRDCATDQACFNGNCESAYNRLWTFRVLDGVAPPQKPGGGGDWDLVPGHAPPDPWVIVTQGATLIDETPIVDDSYAPEWNHDVEILLRQGDEDIQFEMRDSDTVGSDDMTLVVQSPAAWLQTAKDSEPNAYHWAENGIELNILIRPAP